MNVSREEALDALSEIDKAGGKMNRLQSYRSSAVFFIIWGLVWFAANLGAYYQPQHSGVIWLVAIAIGSIASTLYGMRLTRGAASEAGSPRDAQAASWMGKRMALTSGLVFAFLISLGLILQPTNGAEINALISIFFAFLYMGMGVWLGWRLFAIGLVTAAAILTGFYFFRDQFALWMAFVGGGALIAAGLWLRSA